MARKQARPGDGSAMQQADNAGVDSSDGFDFPKTRRRRAQVRLNLKAGGPRQIASALKGARKVSCKPFYIAGISPESSAEDVLTHCRLKNVTVTGCYPIRTRQWGTQVMKLFAEASAVFLGDDFWPDLVRCRPWLKDPPSGSGAGLTRSAQESVTY